MKTKSMFRMLPALLLALCLIQTGFGQAPAPKKVYSEVYYHKLKPGHTFAEARAMENEFKKLHQAQANDGFILGWYMLALDMTTNPNKEYSYITIKNISDPGYFDNGYPQKYFTSVMGADYQPKLTALYKRMGEVKEVAKVEIWEHVDGAQTNPMPSPDKAPVWLVTNFKVKNGQYAEYMARVKKASPFNRDLVVTGGAAGWNFAGLALPSAAEKAYDFSSVYQFISMKALLDSDDTKAEAAFKKTMPGVDYKQFYKEMSDLREAARQEIYYLVEYAVKGASEQAKK